MRGDGSDAVDRSPQTIGIDRLVDESTGIGHRPLERGGGRCDGAAGDENDAAGLSGIGGDEAGVELGSVHPGHHQVTDDGVDTAVGRRDGVERLARIGEGRDREVAAEGAGQGVRPWSAHRS